MGSSQSSTSRAGKFAGTPRRQRAYSYAGGSPPLAPSTAPTVRRNLSNINRNAKEFSKFWLGGGNFQPRASSVKRKEYSVRRSSSARRRSISADPTLRSPPRMIPTGAGAMYGHTYFPPTPPATAYASPRSPPDALQRGLPRVQSVKYTKNNLRNAPSNPIPSTPSSFQRNGGYNYASHRASLTAHQEAALNYRAAAGSATIIPGDAFTARTASGMPRDIYDGGYSHVPYSAHVQHNGDLYGPNSHLRQTSIY